MKAIIHIDPRHLGHNNGSTFELAVPNFFETPYAVYLNQLMQGLDHRCRPFSVIHAIYSNIENLVLWARSEKIGCAVNLCHGMLEYWNVGILKTRIFTDWMPVGGLRAMYLNRR